MRLYTYFILSLKAADKKRENLSKLIAGSQIPESAQKKKIDLNL